MAATRIPVLIIHGKSDRLVPLSNSSRLAPLLPGCELLVMGRTGHNPQEEQPLLFAAAVTEFLNRRLLAPRS